METYSIDDKDGTNSDYPVPIDTLLIPIANGCKRYVQALNEN